MDKMEKPDYRLGIGREEDARIIAGVNIRSKKNNSLDNTFCLFHCSCDEEPTCDCDNDYKCSCNPNCDCTFMRSNCKHCYCVDDWEINCKCHEHSCICDYDR
jgi:hypothetical protein